MKKRDIFLDFTSLLDVTLIVIFFFVIFTHFENEQNKAQVESKTQELQDAITEADEREAEAQDLMEQLEQEIAIVEESSERRASDVSEILEFNRSENIKMILDMLDSGWSIRILHGEEVVAVVSSTGDVGADIISALESAGYDADMTIFCDFVFNGSEGGTARAYRTINEALTEARTVYSHMYVSETDLSIGE